jgi:peptidoglycan/LPS O-acetylase OafA/YrhL
MSLVNEVAWSLEVGVQFYAVAPLLCGLFVLNQSLRRWIIIALMAVAAGFQTQLHLFLFSPLLLPGQIQYFLAGMLFADVYLTQLPDQPRKNGGWDLAAILAIPVIFLLGRRAMISKVLLPCTLFLLCYSVVRGYAVKRFFSHPLIRTIGAMSYSIYLFHNGIIMLAGPYTKNILVSGYGGISLMVQLLVLLPPILLISTCYYVLVERPCMDGRLPGMLSEKSKGISAC